jgi:hypothetical protein
MPNHLYDLSTHFCSDPVDFVQIFGLLEHPKAHQIYSDGSQSNCPYPDEKFGY